VRQAKPGDEAVVILQTGGGTVTGYGLAAAQLLRFKVAGLKLTVAVEQVAASGGYMMCCVADRIVASPFAVLGSIGVISDIPNVYERLKKEGIEFQTVTAGKYKRTLTPTKKVTQEDFIKSTADVENIFVLFRNFVGQNRPQLDMEKIATGETWFGTDAMERVLLCDETCPYFVDHDVYGAYAPPVPGIQVFSL
jgi:ClpP class serine protease